MRRRICLTSRSKSFAGGATYGVYCVGHLVGHIDRGSVEIREPRLNRLTNRQSAQYSPKPGWKEEQFRGNTSALVPSKAPSRDRYPPCDHPGASWWS
jgi:hypothetical protein